MSIEGKGESVCLVLLRIKAEKCIGHSGGGALSDSYNTEMRKGKANRTEVIEDKRTNSTVSGERSAEVTGGKQRRRERRGCLFLIPHAARRILLQWSVKCTS